MLWLQRATLDALSQTAQQAWPHECCGLLLGRRLGDDWQIEQIIPTENASVARGDGERSFEIAPQALFELQRAARASGAEIIGHYHSHPNGRPSPSPRDCAAISDPQALWLILALSKAEQIPTLTAWRPDLSQPSPGFSAISWEIIADQ